MSIYIEKKKNLKYQLILRSFSILYFLNFIFIILLKDIF